MVTFSFGGGDLGLDVAGAFAGSGLGFGFDSFGLDSFGGLEPFGSPVLAGAGGGFGFGLGSVSWYRVGPHRNRMETNGLC